MTEATRIFTIVVLGFTALMVGLHIAVAARGFYWYNDNTLYLAGNGVNYGEKNFNQYCAYIIIAACIQFILCVILIIDSFKALLSQRNRAFLLAITFAVQFSLMIVIALLASTSSNEKELIGYRFGHPYEDLNAYYNTAVADTVINYVVKLIPWLIILYLAMKELEAHKLEVEGEHERPAQEVPPPISGGRL